MMTNEEAVATVKCIFNGGANVITDVAGEMLDIALQKGENTLFFPYRLLKLNWLSDKGSSCSLHLTAYFPYFHLV